MKNILTVIIGVILFYHSGFSQETSKQAERYAKPVKIPTMKQRYKIDYELVNPSLLGSDSLVLLKIDPDLIENARKETEDVIIHPQDAGVAVRVYSHKRVALTK